MMICRQITSRGIGFLCLFLVLSACSSSRDLDLLWWDNDISTKSYTPNIWLWINECERIDYANSSCQKRRKLLRQGRAERDLDLKAAAVSLKRRFSKEVEVGTPQKFLESNRFVCWINGGRIDFLRSTFARLPKETIEYLICKTVTKHNRPSKFGSVEDELRDVSVLEWYLKARLQNDTLVDIEARVYDMGSVQFFGAPK